MAGLRTSPNGQSDVPTGQAAIHSSPPPSSPTALRAHELSQVRAAENQATKVYPGPVGDLIARELHVYAECGHRFDRAGLLPRVARQVLGLPDPTHRAQHTPAHPNTPRPTWPATHNR